MRIFILLSLFCSFNLLAHPEKLTSVMGTNNQINLKTINHSFSGSIKNRMVQGFKKAGKFESELTILEGDKKYQGTFKNQEARFFGGEISLPTADGSLKTHTVRLVKFLREKDQFIFSFDKQEFVVSVKADKFEHGHYINPEYSMMLEGREISFKILEGEACYGYSAHLISMIMGAYIF